MTPEESVQTYEQAYLPLNHAIATPIWQLLESAFSFYRDERAVALVEAEGDMLLFQYGVYDWGSGPFFEVDLTRQFVELERDGDENVYSQFHLTCYYAVDEALIALGRGNCWCRDTSELDRFSKWVEAHPVLVAVESLSRLKTDVTWELI